MRKFHWAAMRKSHKIVTILSLSMVGMLSSALGQSSPLPKMADGRELVATGVEKEVVVQVSPTDYVSLKVPILAFVDKRESRINKEDAVRFRAVEAELRALAAMPPSVRVREENIVRYSRALEQLNLLTNELEARASVYSNVTPVADTTPKGQ